MILILMAFAILMFLICQVHEKKEKAKVYILYFFFMTVSLIVSLLLKQAEDLLSVPRSGYRLH